MSGVVKSLGKIAKVALPVAGVALPFAAPALAASGVAGATAALGTFGPPTAAQSIAASLGFAGSSTAASVIGGASSLFGGGGGLGSVLSTASNALSGVNSIVGAVSRPAQTYFGAQSTAFQTKQAAQAQVDTAETYEYQATVSERNASIQEMNREYEQQTRFAMSQRERRENRKALGTAKAAAATSGVELSGSVQDVLGYSASEGALNVALGDYASQFRQRGFEIQRDAAYEESEQLKKAGEKARRNAEEILDEGKKAERAQTSVAFAQGVEAIPDILGGVGQVIDFFEGL